MVSNCHSEFYELGDVSACIAGAVSIVYRNGDSGLSCFESVLFDKASVDSAACAATIQETFHGQRLGPCDGVQDDFNKEVALHAFLSNDARRFAEFIESLSGRLPS